jgi:hypothetical protein
MIVGQTSLPPETAINDFKRDFLQGKKTIIFKRNYSKTAIGGPVRWKWNDSDNDMRLIFQFFQNQSVTG